MGLAESNQVVNSYLEGLRNQLTKRQLDQEQQYRLAEESRAQQQQDLQKQQFQELVSQHALAQKAAAADFALNVRQHAAEYGANNEPDVDPATGKPIVDEKGIGQYTVNGPDGVPLKFQVPTREQQQKLANLNLQKQSDIRQQEAEKTARVQHSLEEDSRIKEMGISNAQALALEILRANSSAGNIKMEQQGASARQAQQLGFEKTKELIDQGVLDPSVLTGGEKGQTVDRVHMLADLALEGKLSIEELKGEPIGVRNGVQRIVNNNGGLVLSKGQIDNINKLTGLANLAPKMKDAIASQPFDGVISGNTIGHAAGMLAPDRNKEFDQLAGQSANIAKGVGGEEGQRLTNFSTALTAGNYIPKITNKKSVNLIGLNNYINQIKDVANNEALGAIPDSQKARILSNRGLTKLTPYTINDLTAPVQQQQQPAGTQGNPQVDPNSFFLGGAK